MTKESQVRAPRAEVCRQFLECMARLNHVPSVVILKLGRDWQAQALPSGVPLGPKRRCYENAGTLALERPELTYVEGYACPPGLIPVHHAWCVDAQGRVIDNTLADPGNAQYFGVPISRDQLQTSVEETRHWGILAEHMTPERLAACLADVQSGAWPADEAAAKEVHDLLRPFL
ncbi:hypothetical protein [Burkholderia ubonensis]|nr:hypothetical protein [Burkholderia ubonensis]KVP65607.1 hypothetical protein WJ93_24105 [Burkholderia ubonensis]